MAIRPDRLDAVVPHAAGWYGGEDPLATFFGAPLRLADERAAARHLACLVHVGGDGAGARDRSSRSASPRSTSTTSGSRTGSARASGSSRATRRSSSATSRAPRRSSPERGSRRPCAEAGCGPRGTSTTRPTTSTGRSTCCQAERGGLEQLVPGAELDARAPLRLAARLLDRVDRLPAAVRHDLHASLGEERRRCSRPNAREVAGSRVLEQELAPSRSRPSCSCR